MTTNNELLMKTIETELDSHAEGFVDEAAHALGAAKAGVPLSAHGLKDFIEANNRAYAAARLKRKLRDAEGDVVAAALITKKYFEDAIENNSLAPEGLAVVYRIMCQLRAVSLDKLRAEARAATGRTFSPSDVRKMVKNLKS